MPQDNPFDQFDTAAPPKAGPVYGAPADPFKVQSSENDQTRTGIAVQGAQRDARKETRETSNDVFQHEQTLRGDYNANAAVKVYADSMPVFATALKTRPDGAGDLTLVTLYAKLNDPSTGVREGESASVQGGSPWVAAKIAELKGKFTDGGKLPAEYRDALRQEIITKMKQFNTAYNAQRERYKADAKSYGLDPDRVVGPHIGGAFMDELNAYDHRNDKPEGGTNMPEQRGGLPVGTDIQFNMDKGPDGPFDRETYLQKHFGITGDQETQILGFFNANKGNPNFTAEQAKAWYTQNHLPIPADQALTKSVEDTRKGLGVGPIDTSAGEKAYKAKLQSGLDANGFDPNGAGAYAGRAVTGAEFGLGDELEGVLGAGKALVTNQPVGDGYVMARDEARLAQEQMRDKQGWLGTGAEVGGSLLGGAGLFKSARTIPEMMRAGATVGGVEGYGRGEGLGGSIGGGVVGMATGGATAGVLGKVQPKLSGVVGRFLDNSEGREVQAAADRLNGKFETDMTMLPADVGGTGTRMATGAFGRTLGGIPIADASKAAVKGAGEVRDAVAGSIGHVADDTGAGQAAQKGANAFIDASEKRGGELYEKISVPPKAEVSLANTRPALEEITRGFESNPELSAIWTGHPRLKATLEALTPTDNVALGAKMRDAAKADLDKAQASYKAIRAGTVQGDLNAAGNAVKKARAALREADAKSAELPTDGKLSWQDMKRLRTIVGQISGRPGIESDGASIDAMRKFYGALTADMKVTAEATSPRALSEFNRATQFWRGRETRISDVLSGILGSNLNKGEASAFEQINRWAQVKGGDFKRLSQAIRSMPGGEADTVRASIIARMGNASPGRQNAEGNLFSPTEWASQWNKLSPRAKSVLFPNVEHRTDLNDLAKVMGGMKRANEYQNFSNTSLGTNLAAHTTALGASAASGSFLGAILTGAAAGGEFAMGKLLASPKFARWLARAPAVSATAMPSYITKLSSIAANDNVVGPEVTALLARLQTGLAQSPLRAAAADQEGDGRRVPVQN